MLSFEEHGMKQYSVPLLGLGRISLRGFDSFGNFNREGFNNKIGIKTFILTMAEPFSASNICFI